MARTKRVFGNDEVCHVWAQQTQEEGTNRSRNCSFEGATLVSYGHYTIARIYGEGDKRLVLFNQNGYSATTKGQIARARSAVSHLETMYVPICDVGPDMKGDHRANLTSLFAEVDAMAAKQHKARKSDYRGGILGLLGKITRYCEYFRIRSLLKKKERALLAMSADELWRHFGIDVVAFEQRKARANAADDERNRKAREAWEDRKRQAALTHEEKLAEWRDGKHVNFGWHCEETYLRVVGDHVETSKGVSIRLKEAKAIWRILCNGEALPATIARHYHTTADNWDGETRDGQERHQAAL